MPVRSKQDDRLLTRHHLPCTRTNNGSVFVDDGQVAVGLTNHLKASSP